MNQPSEQWEHRVLLLAPTARDAALSRNIMTEAGIACTVCQDLGELCRELQGGAGTAVLTEEVMGNPEVAGLVEALRQQQPWSDLPLIVLTQGGQHSPYAAPALETLGNVMLLELPARVATLISAVRTALRARGRQYQLRGHLVERRRAEEALQEANRRKDEFLAMLAHELRNPLAPLSNALQLLRRDNLGADRVERLREMMERQVHQLTHLVDDLLEVSRITRGKIRLRKERVDLAAVVARAVETSRAFIEAQAHTLTVELPAEPLWCDVDPVRVEQVLGNLLNNAAKYMEKGGQIWLAAEPADGQVVIRVRDTGVGIAPEVLPHIFDLFTQADHSLDRSRGGLGIGLSLVRSLVEMHGGRVEAFSDGPGQGSEFTLRLPVLTPGNAAQEVYDGPEIAAAGSVSRRVLVVDDNADSAETVASLLRAWKHEVKVAYDGPSALELARSYQPDVVLLDIGLPGMDGYQVARQLRRQPGFARVVLVAMTGYGREEDFRRSREAGFDQHLVKPIDASLLKRTLAEDSRMRNQPL
jgi:signal transduction histidine kinase/ActR/RegA family two-component response regulator